MTSGSGSPSRYSPLAIKSQNPKRAFGYIRHFSNQDIAWNRLEISDHDGDSKTVEIS